MTPVGLETEHAAEPLDVESAAPHLSWRFAAPAAFVRQDAYQILVASDLALLDAGSADLWDSGEVRSAMQSDVPYGGAPLKKPRLCYFRHCRHAGLVIQEGCLDPP